MEIESETANQIEIIYEDDHLVAINKEAGLLVHRSWLDKGETRFAMQLTRDAVGCHVFPVHRLDKPTSGVLLFAKSSAVARSLVRSLYCTRGDQAVLGRSTWFYARARDG